MQSNNQIEPIITLLTSGKLLYLYVQCPLFSADTSVCMNVHGDMRYCRLGLKSVKVKKFHCSGVVQIFKG